MIETLVWNSAEIKRKADQYMLFSGLVKKKYKFCLNFGIFTCFDS